MWGIGSDANPFCRRREKRAAKTTGQAPDKRAGDTEEHISGGSRSAFIGDSVARANAGARDTAYKESCERPHRSSRPARVDDEGIELNDRL